MFTLEQIQRAHKKVKTGADFPQYVRDLKDLGVIYYDTYVTNGRSNYFGENNFAVYGDPKYPSKIINHESSSKKFKQALSIHQKGQTDYPTFCQDAADAGVEKWTTHIIEMTVTYLDKQGVELTIKSIPAL